MAQTERLMVLEHTGEEPIVESWDSKEIRIEPGETITLLYGAGVTFKERHPELHMIEERQGEAPGVVVDEVILVNPGIKAIDVTWDGHPYHFEPGSTSRLNTELAETLMVQARRQGAKLVIEGTSEPEDSTPEGQTTVSALAKELKMKVKDVVALANSLEIEATSGKSPLDEAAVARIKEEATKPAAQESDESDESTDQPA